MSLSNVYGYLTIKDDYAIFPTLRVHASWFPCLNQFATQWTILSGIYTRPHEGIPATQTMILAPLDTIHVDDVEVVWFEDEPNTQGWGGDTLEMKFQQTLGFPRHHLNKTHLFLYRCWVAIANSKNDTVKFWYDFNVLLMNHLMSKTIRFVMIGTNLKKITSYLTKRGKLTLTVKDPRAGYVQKLLPFESVVDFLNLEKK